jgi:hypothetical protein
LQFYLVFFCQWADLLKSIKGVKSAHLIFLKVAKVAICRDKYAQSATPFFPGKHTMESYMYAYMINWIWQA